MAVSYEGNLDAAIAAAWPYAQADHGVRGVLSLFCVDPRTIKLNNPNATKVSLEALSQFGAVMLAGYGVQSAQKHGLDEHQRVVVVCGNEEPDFMAAYAKVKDFLYEKQSNPALATL